MLKFEEEKSTRLEEKLSCFQENGLLEVPKNVANDLRYWDKKPISTKDDFFKSYDELEDENEHDGCAYLIAKYAKDRKTMQMILYLSAMHNVYGSLPQELAKLRYELTNPYYKKFAGQK